CSNFLGWVFVCVLIVRVFLLMERLLDRWIGERGGVWNYPFKGLGAVGLYFGVFGFNLTMTFLIGEIEMGWVGAFLGLLLLVLLINQMDRYRDNRFFNHEEHEEHEEHKKIFL